MTNLAQLRLNLATARAEQRTANDALSTAKALATMNVSGKNDDERKKATAQALIDSDQYNLALITLRDREFAVEQLEAQIAIEEDTIRLRELGARERLAEALLGRRTDNAVADAAIDQATRRNGYQYGRTAEDVHWDQYMGHQEPLYNDWEKQG